MLAIALKPFGERSLVGLMKLPAALLTSPLSGPLSSQIRCTIASTAAASRMSTECVRTRPPCASISCFAVSSSTPPRRPPSHSSAPSSRYLAAISLPSPVPPPVTRLRLPLRRSSLNMRAPRVGSGHFSDLRRCVGRFAEAERPVFLRHFDEIDPNVLLALSERGEVVGDAAEKRALLLQAATCTDGDLDDDDVVGARDAEVAGVVNQVARLVFREQLETVQFRDVDRLDERAMQRVAKLAAKFRGAPLAERDAHERHGASCRGERRSSANAAAWAGP